MNQERFLEKLLELVDQANYDHKVAKSEKEWISTKQMSLHDMAVRLCEGGVVKCSGYFIKAKDVGKEEHPCYLCSIVSACNQEICDLCFECDGLTRSGHILYFANEQPPLVADSAR